MAGDRRERPPDLQGEESVLATRGRPRGGRRDGRGCGGPHRSGAIGTGWALEGHTGRRATQVGCKWHQSGHTGRVQLAPVGPHRSGAIGTGRALGEPHRSGALGTDQVLGVLLGRGECLSPLARSAGVYSVGEVY